jgi:hypothetical protein
MFQDAEVIHSYSRAQALEDGMLVDLRQDELDEVARNAGFRYPIACTDTVFFSCVDVTPAAARAGNDMKGRLHDVLWMLKLAIRRAEKTDRIAFQVAVVRDEPRPTLTELVAVCGPDDDGEPVITIMFPGEE